MSISVEWNDRSRTVIICRFQDPWSIEDLLDARKAWHRMIKSVDWRIPIVLDLRQSHAPPPGTLRHFSAMRRAHHPRQAELYVIGLNAAYQRLASIIFSEEDCAGAPVHLAESFQAAGLA